MRKCIVPPLQIQYSEQARIQDSEGGVSYIQKGGFRTGISGAGPNCCRVLGKSTSKKKLQTAVWGGGGGGGPITQKKTLYPRMVNIPQTLVPGSQVGVIMREDCAIARLSCHVRWPGSLGYFPRRLALN